MASAHEKCQAFGLGSIKSVGFSQRYWLNLPYGWTLWAACRRAATGRAACSSFRAFCPVLVPSLFSALSVLSSLSLFPLLPVTYRLLLFSSRLICTFFDLLPLNRLVYRTSPRSITATFRLALVLVFPFFSSGIVLTPKLAAYDIFLVLSFIFFKF